ncbi:hypothetical protein D9M73_180750 [compost metagenome]
MRQAAIHQHGSKALLADPLDGFKAIFCRAYRQAQAAQHGFHDTAVDRIVLHQQYLIIVRHRRSCSRWRRQRDGGRGGECQRHLQGKGRTQALTAFTA